MRLATMLPLVVVVGFLGCSEGTTEPEPNEADAALFQASANSGRLEITPLQYNFGEVEVGNTVTTIILLTNFNGHAIIVSSVAFQDGSDPDFSLGNVPATAPFSDDSVDALYKPGDKAPKGATESPPYDIGWLSNTFRKALDEHVAAMKLPLGDVHPSEILIARGEIQKYRQDMNKGT